MNCFHTGITTTTYIYKKQCTYIYKRIIQLVTVHYLHTKSILSLVGCGLNHITCTFNMYLHLMPRPLLLMVFLCLAGKHTIAAVQQMFMCVLISFYKTAMHLQDEHFQMSSSVSFPCGDMQVDCYHYATNVNRCLINVEIIKKLQLKYIFN